MFIPYTTQFKTFEEVKVALNDHNKTVKKGTKSVISNGRIKKFVCTNCTCTFLLELYRKRPTTGTRISHVDHIPVGHWYVHKYIEHNNSCIGNINTSAKEIASLAPFASAVVTSQQNSASTRLLKNIVSKICDGSTISDSKITRAKLMVVNDNEKNINNSYSEIASLLYALKNKNPGTRVCYQVDSESRFYRLFLLLESSKKILNGLMPILEVDGTFMKHHSYNGICLLAISQTAEKENVPIAIAFVPTETVDNFLWFFLNLKAGGINMDNFAVFCDHGKQMLAHKRLVNFGIQWLHLKNCTLHIARNVCAKFSPNDDHLKN
jgi:hypothetical protein